MMVFNRVIVGNFRLTCVFHGLYLVLLTCEVRGIVIDIKSNKPPFAGGYQVISITLIV